MLIKSIVTGKMMLIALRKSWFWQVSQLAGKGCSRKD